MEANALVVCENLQGKSNYERWSILVQIYLMSRGLWNVVDDLPYEGESTSDQKNCAALHTILLTCEAAPFSVIKNIRSARQAWSTLQAQYGTGAEMEKNQIESNPSASAEPYESNSLVIANQTEIQFEINRDAAINSKTSDSLTNNTNVESNEPKTTENQLESNPDAEINNKTVDSLTNNTNVEPDEPKLTPTVETRDQYLSFFQALRDGDWYTAEKFLETQPDAIWAKTNSGKNALHVAITSGHVHIVEKLANGITNEDLEMVRMDGLPALMVAIDIKSLPIVKCLIKRHRNLINIATIDDRLPLHFAITTCRNTEMVPYLYSITPIEELISLNNGVCCAKLLRHCIFCQQYDIALSMLDRVPQLALMLESNMLSPLSALANSIKHFDSEFDSLTFWRRWIYASIDIRSDKEDINGDADSACLRNFFSGVLRKLVFIPLHLLDIKGIYEMKLVHAKIREILRHMCKAVKETSDPMVLHNAGLSHAMESAAFLGNVEFITGIAKANPELVWGIQISRRVIEIGIQSRQPKIFSLVYGLYNKVGLASSCDSNGSTMLHNVALIASPTLLNRIPGAALQMQRELQWFKELQAIASPDVNSALTTYHPFWTKESKEYLRAQEIFTKSHRELVIAGEKWMKETSSSCTVVGALIITVTFAAAFTFPGGNEQTHGYPMFIDKKLFRVFTILNAVALSASTTSVLMFLGILTSRYAEEDFLTSLPKKLIIGLSSLFFSIAAMLVAFCVGLSVMFNEELWIFLPSALLASIPVALFAAIQFPLLVDIIMSTYGPSIFIKKTPPWI